ncbi:MAG: HlyD family secretion protein [Bacteroidota bacterium]
MLNDSQGRQFDVKSPVDGTLHFLDFWKTKNLIRKGDLLFKITPLNHGSYIGKLKVPHNHIEGLSIGQEVRIPSTNLLFSSENDLKGSIAKIATVPDDQGKHIVEVSFPGLSELPAFSLERTTMAYIIAEDLNLLERLFYQIKDIFNVNK